MIDRTPLLSFHAVTRHYRGNRVAAVNGINLDVFRGEIVALIGESGSGKTSLLRLAAGLESPDGGEILLDGHVVAGETIAREVPPELRQLGLVFQDGALFPHLTVQRNVDYGLVVKDKKARADRVGACLELVGLAGKEKRFPHELSGGERQRLALARALAPEPKLLLLDEPFSHLDPALRRKLREEIRDILQRLGQTALLVTHDPEDALAIASRVVIIDRGNLMQTGTPAEVYRYPADQYCAERFGPANRVVDHASGEVTWKRPEDARWIPCDVANEGDPVIVESVREMGAIYEVRVAPGTQPGESWLCFLKDASGLHPGDHGRVAWRGTPERVAWKS
jgi:iron(III) transport system ATP-binding protein